MSAPSVKFNKQDRPEFFKELRKRVNQHFKEKNISRYADARMKFKTGFMLALYLVPFALMLGGIVTGFWPVMGMYFIMGLGTAGIGLSIMHDANHSSYSRNKKVNQVMSWMLNIIGGYHINWKIQHNVLHHSFTNVEGCDEDIEKPVMRFTPNQPYKGIYRFQVFYAPILYAIVTIYWLLMKDFEQLVRYNKMGLLKGQGLTFKQALLHVIGIKLAYFGVVLVLPMFVVPLSVGSIVLGFVLMHIVGGIILSLIFQSAHVIEEAEFYVRDDEGKVENNWAVHQMKTTGNFATGNRLFSWYAGGLNYQIEHHLFPDICHVHYRDIAPIVKQTAEEFGLPYHEHKTFFGAVRSHFGLLNKLGKNEYMEEAPAKAA